MARELTVVVGVIAEKRKPMSRWADEYWIPVGVMMPAGHLAEGDVMVSDEGVTRYYMGLCELTCHAAETEAYVHNFESAAPALYVVLRRDHEGAHPLPWFVQTVTASPYLAQDHEDSAEDIVERIVMPADIEAAIREFIDRYHKEEPFRKRKRGPAKPEKPAFGKEPIFLARKRKPGGGLDG